MVRPWLGARLQSVTSEMARSMGLPLPQGALIADVWRGGPADRAGLRQGDVVLQVEGAPIVDAAALTYAIQTRRPGASIPLSVRRADGRQDTLTLRAEAPPAIPAKDERALSGRHPFDGATVVNISPAVAEEVGMDLFNATGVLVVNVQGGLARGVGLRRGDIVREVNGLRITAVRDLAAAVANPARAWRVTIERDGRTVTATFAG